MTAAIWRYRKWLGEVDESIVAFRSAKGRLDCTHILRLRPWIALDSTHCAMCLSRSERRRLWREAILPAQSPVTILAGLQAGFVRVFGNISPQMPILLRAADEVVEGLLLPKLPLFPDPSVRRPREEWNRVFET
jgi:hypothetical protein